MQNHFLFILNCLNICKSIRKSTNQNTNNEELYICWMNYYFLHFSSLVQRKLSLFNFILFSFQFLLRKGESKRAESLKETYMI